MNVPFIDIQRQIASVGPPLPRAIERVIASGSFVLGPFVEQFEQDFAELNGVEHCIGVNSGTSALHLALAAFELGPGDEVITTPDTWISTAWAISYVGATPVFVDIDPETHLLDPQRVRAAITPATKAILPVDLYGQIAPLHQLRQLADEYDLLLIEDAAQAHGAILDGRRAGALGDVGCFSFYPIKNLGAFGEAGAVVTNNPEIAQRIRYLRDHAQRERHCHITLGFNARMDAIQAAVLQTKMPHLDRWNTARRRHARHYVDLLAGVPSIQLPRWSESLGHVWHLFVVLVPAEHRESIRSQLRQRGIATGIHYPTPVPLQPAYAHLGYQPGDLPVAENVMQRCLSLPLYPELASEQVEYVARTVADVMQHASCSSPTVDQ